MRRECENAISINTAGYAFLLAIFTNEALLANKNLYYTDTRRDLSLDSSDRYENKNDDCPSGSAHHKALG